MVVACWAAALSLEPTLLLGGVVLFARAAAATRDARNVTSSRGNRKSGGAEGSDLFPNELLQSDTVKFFVLKTEVERTARYGFISWIVECFEKRVFQCIVNGHALFGMNLQHFAHGVQSLQGSSREL